jgi:hypothetical protein
MYNRLEYNYHTITPACRQSVDIYPDSFEVTGPREPLVYGTFVRL